MLTKKQDNDLRNQLKQNILDCFDQKKITRKSDFNNWVKERIEDYMYALYEDMRTFGSTYEDLVKMIDGFNWEGGEEEKFDEYLENLENSFYIKSEGTLHHPELKYFHNTDIQNTIYKNDAGFHLHCEVKSWWGGNVLVELFLDEGLGGALIGGSPYYGTYYKGQPILRAGRLRMCDDKAGERSHKAVMEIITMFKEYMKKTA